jgi:ribosomal protein S18 acetylase RimI-like enzyme
MLTIRPATSADEQAVIALWRDCGLVVPHNDPAADFRFAKQGPNSDVLVGEESGEIAASVMVGHDGHRGLVYYVAVAPAARGRGIGRKMMNAAEDWLRERNVPKVQLMIRETNTDVAKFYERIGFVTEPRTVMSKWLKGKPGT